MKNKKILVVGATGLVGSQVVKILDERGLDVTAMVRRPGQTISGASTSVNYVTGDLRDRHSLDLAVKDMDIVISSANGIIPEKKKEHVGIVNDKGYENLIEACEQAGVKRFVQSSVPVHRIEHQVPELKGKRGIEKRLEASPMEVRIIRNPAFMDVWLVMSGCIQAENLDPHSTTLRNYGFMKTWKNLVGNFVKKYGLFIALGGAKHGSYLIATKDVAEMMVGAASRDEGEQYQIFESGGPEWWTWREVADELGQRLGKKKVRIIPLPAGMARMLQLVVTPFSKPAGNVLALIRFVALYQPKWDPKPVVELLQLPEQTTVKNYLDIHLKKQ